jgi:hypothetical protein
VSTSRKRWSLRNYREICQGIRMIRLAVEETFGDNRLPASEHIETPIQECEAIARAIYAAGGKSKTP